MIVLITGANGYIASELIKSLEQDSNIHIYAVVRKKHIGCFENRINVKYLYFDMEEYDMLWSAVSSQVDCIVHCTWDGARGKRNHRNFIQYENILGTMKLLSSAKWLKCKKFVQMGSLAEYGMVYDQKFPITEQTRCMPKTPYAKAKYECFLKLSGECSMHKMDFCELRLGSVYGPNMQSTTMIKYVISGLRANKEIELESDCGQCWEFVHIRDVIAILQKIVRTENKQGIHVLNVSSGENKKLKIFMEEIEKMVGGKGHINFGKAVNQSRFGCAGIYCDVSLLKEYMGKNYRFTTFEEGIKEIVRMEKGDI